MAAESPKRKSEPIRPVDEPASRRIIAAARPHFFTHGFRSVTMDDLAAELGVSKKTLYASFPSKAALLETVLLNKFGEVEADLDRILSECSKDVLPALHRLLACVKRHTEEIQAPFVRDIRREAPEMFKLIETRRRTIIQRYFGKLFDAGRKAGVIRKDFPIKLMIEILLGATEAIMNPSKMAELGLTPKTGFGTIITVILEGVLTDRARSKP